MGQVASDASDGASRNTPGQSKLAFVLSGGGSLGSVQVGCLQALISHDIYPDVIVGTSVGALNGAILASDPSPSGVEKLKRIWLSLKARPPVRRAPLRTLLRLMSGSQYLYTNDGLRELVRSNLAGIAFEDLAVPFVAIASRMEDGGMTVFGNGPLEPALLASTAVPGLFPPVEVDGVKYVDGSLAGNCTLGPALDLGCRRFLVVECPHPPPVDGFGVMRPVARALWASMLRSCHMEIAGYAREYPVVHLEPTIPIPNHRFDDFSDADVLIEHSRRWCEEFLAGDEGAKARGFTRGAMDATARASVQS